MNRPERVLVTGAAGFIGSTLVDRLIAQGREVVGLDNFDPFYAESEKRRNLESALDERRFRLIQADIRDAQAVEGALRASDCQGIVHLAALAGVQPSLARPSDYADVNVLGSSRVFEAAVRCGKPRVVFASSSSVYGEREDGPFCESDPVERPVSPYAATKRAGELIAHSFHHAHGLPITCARIFTAYGPRQRPDLAIRKFAERMRRGESIPVHGDGSALRDFTYVDDLVTGLCAALDRDLGYAILNLGAGRAVALSEVIQCLEQALGCTARIERLPRPVGDVPRTWADITAARGALDYAPAVPFETGIARFVAWLDGLAGRS